MDTLKKLIEKYCPEGVEYKTLGEIATDMYTGRGVSKEQIGTGDYPCTTIGSISNQFSIWFEECHLFMDKNLIKNPKYFEFGDLLLVTASQVIRNVGDCCAYLGNKKSLAGEKIIVMKHKQNPKYLSYALSTTNAKTQKEKYSKIGTVATTTKEELKQIKIPLPPTEIQEKIVEFLEQIRDQKAKEKLEKELELRKKQYEFYRDKVISESTTELKSLGEIATEIHKNNLIISKEQISVGGGLRNPCVTLFEMHDVYNICINNCVSSVDINQIPKEKYCKKGDLLVTQRGFVFEEVGTACAYMGEEDCIIDGRIFILKHNQNAKYLAYALSTHNALIQKRKCISGILYPQLTVNTLKKIKIPLPSLEVQNEIVEKLDKLRESYTEIKNKIPRIIELNRKRYEYYRDLIIDEYLKNPKETKI